MQGPEWGRRAGKGGGKWGRQGRAGRVCAISMLGSRTEALLLKRLQFDPCLIYVLLLLNVRDVVCFLSSTKLLAGHRKDAILWTLLMERDQTVQQGIRKRVFREVARSVGLSTGGDPFQLFKVLHNYRLFPLQSYYAFHGPEQFPRGGLVSVSLSKRGKLVLTVHGGEFDPFAALAGSGERCLGCHFCSGSTSEFPLIVNSDGRLGIHGAGGGSSLIKLSASVRSLSLDPDVVDDQSENVGDVSECLSLHGEEASSGRPLHLRRLSLPQATPEHSGRTFSRLRQKHNAIVTGPYGSHGPELIQLTFKELPTGEALLRGDKVTGDPNVPAGHLSFRLVCDAASAEELESQSAPPSLGQTPHLYRQFVSEDGPPNVVNLRERMHRVEFLVSGTGQINVEPREWEPHQVDLRAVFFKPGDELFCSILWLEDRHVIDFTLVELPLQFGWCPKSQSGAGVDDEGDEEDGLEFHDAPAEALS